MNRRNFFRALSALAALPIIPKWLKAKAPDYPPENLTHLYAWDIDRYAGDEGLWSTPRAYSFDEPKEMDWGGDVGRVLTFICTMYCGDMREKSYHAEGWGCIQHSRERHENGIWVIEWVVLGANTRDKKWDTIEA